MWLYIKLKYPHALPLYMGINVNKQQQHYKYCRDKALFIYSALQMQRSTQARCEAIPLKTRRGRPINNRPSTD